MAKLLPIILLLIGLGAGVGAGIVLAPTNGTESTAEGAAGSESAEADKEDAEAGTEFVKLSNHFVVPVISETRVEALVVAALSLEVTTGMTADVYAVEPKLRDVFLQTMLDHASIGGFDGRFTATARMDSLRIALLEAARAIMGKSVHDVLITEIARQDS
jgi:hypothetical protein